MDECKPSPTHRLRAFLKRETLLLISVSAALLSVAFVPPDREYAAYIDWRVLSLLFCLMAVVAGFQSCGAFQWRWWRASPGRGSSICCPAVWSPGSGEPGA